jgi:predicted Zn-dependent protease
LFSITGLAGCTTIYNPATQRTETLLINTQSEVALGNDMDKQFQKKLKILYNPGMQGRLEHIGNKIALVSDRQDLAYHFRIVEDADLNAFALPGGFIYVNSGLINTANDSELAGVIAHEIGHVAARHSVKKLQATLGYQIIMSIALGISGQQAMSQAMDVVFNLASLGYSRSDESLADKLSVRYTKRAGFNPRGIITFFEKLKKESKSKGTHYNPTLLSSHPAIDERIQNVSREISLNP